MQKLRVCLEEVDEGQDAAAEQALAKLVIEASSVICWLTHFNTETVKALHGLMLDTGQPVEHPPGDAFYSNLVVRYNNVSSFTAVLSVHVQPSFPNSNHEMSLHHAYHPVDTCQGRSI